MKPAAYARLEKTIAAADAGSIRQRWHYGRLLLVDEGATTPAGNLRHGINARLIDAAARAGRKLSEREIRYRLQCGKTYPCESQIGSAAADFDSWRSLCDAGFPPYPAAEGERPFDPRTTRDIERSQRGRNILPDGWEQAALFERFDDDATLAALKRYMDEQDELTARFQQRGADRRTYFGQLLKAVDGDLSKTYGEARAALENA